MDTVMYIDLLFNDGAFCRASTLLSASAVMALGVIPVVQVLVDTTWFLLQTDRVA
jgi:hypothetical protein